MTVGSPAEAELIAVLGDRFAFAETVAVVRRALSRRGLVVCFIGQEGVGKTTAAGQLAAFLDANAVPRRRLHQAAFAANLFRVPLLILYNRCWSRRILIMDRTVYDNLAVHAARQDLSSRLISILVRMLSAVYPRLDVGFRLHCPSDLLLNRRPRADFAVSANQAAVYELIGQQLDFTAIETTMPQLCCVLKMLDRAARRATAEPLSEERTTS